MRVGFLNNQIDARGTGHAMFHYAHYNETLLGNTSKIYTFYGADHAQSSWDIYKERFEEIHFVNNGIKNVDVLYHIKSGFNDFFRPPDVEKYVVHAVFDNEPHGDRYATISEWMGERYSLPYVPHIVELPEYYESLRKDLGIPANHIVYGRLGGEDTFDIPFVWEAINEVLMRADNTWFIFMNTNKPDIPFWDNNRVVFVDPTLNPFLKKAFINTTDAMLHARARGETFGISVGEFAISGKRVFTYLDSGEKAHIHALGNKGLYYSDKDSLVDKLLYGDIRRTLGTGYDKCTPELVMQKFKEVFLD
jgi:hypothetical protein